MSLDFEGLDNCFDVDDDRVTRARLGILFHSFLLAN